MTIAPTSAAAFPLLVVAAALVNGEGRMLVQQRPPGKSMAGLWEFPGGKVESDETPEAALARELREELGIAVSEASLSPVCFASESIAGRPLLLLLYVTRAWSGEAKALHASALRWVWPNELHDLAMPGADRPMIRVLEALF